MSNPTIICVDDEMVVLNSIQEQLLRVFGKENAIEVSDSGEDALELFEELMEEGTSVPLIISDQIMPGMKGNELLKAIYEKSPDTVTILLTGQADMEAVVDVVNNAGLYRYISKPWNEDDLLLTVKEALRKYEKERELAIKNQQLVEYSTQLEQKVKDRTIDLQNALEELHKKNDGITASINYAHRIQRAILPLKDKIDQLLPECFIYYSPRDIVSGDFYFVDEVERGFTTFSGGPKNKSRKIVIAAADCTGHGVPGAFMSVIGHSLIVESLSHMRGMCDPNRILNNLHLGVHQALKQEETKTNDGMDISLCVFDPEELTLEFSGAKNPVMYVQNGEIFQIKGDKSPIGGHQHELTREYQCHNIPIKDENGKLIPTMVYLFSDGYQDQFGGPQKRKFMVKQFRDLLCSIAAEPMQKQQAILDTTIKAWMNEGSESQVDDILVMGFRIS